MILKQTILSAGVSAALCVTVAVAPSASAAVTDAHIESVIEVWDQAPHNAFTDLVRYDGQFYLTFREASRHTAPPVGQPGGQVRILRSADGVAWESAATFRLSAVDNDLRDPKLSVTPDGRLMFKATNIPHANRGAQQSYSWFSTDGSSWSGQHPVLPVGHWLWRTAWNDHDDRLYGFSYDAGQITLRVSGDGINFTSLGMKAAGGANETALTFLRDGSAVAVVRRGNDQGALVGTSSGDYAQWTFRDTGEFIGGPNLIELPDGRIIAGGRFFNAGGGQRMALALVDPVAGTMERFLTLPSGGDSSYPGFVWHDDKLWVSYYASHQGGQSRIYLATVAFDNVPEPASAACLAIGVLAVAPRQRRRRVNDPLRTTTS